MPALKEIAKKFRKTVDFEGEAFEIRGLSGDEITDLVLEFPAFESLLVDGFGSVDIKAMIKQAPAGIAKFIATGLVPMKKSPSSEDIEEIRTWPMAAQLDLLAPIAELSLPRKIVGPFVELIRGGNDETSGRVPDTPSPN